MKKLLSLFLGIVLLLNLIIVGMIPSYAETPLGMIPITMRRMWLVRHGSKFANTLIRLILMFRDLSCAHT